MPPRATTVGAAKPSLNSKRSRKSRTQVFDSSSSSSSSSSDSSSDSDSDSATTPAAKPRDNKKQKTLPSARDASPSPSSSASSSSADSDADEEAASSLSNPAQAFPSWYLRTVTQELAEDLDRVRNAPDFGDAALPLLVHALQQGEGVFSAGEKARVMVGGAAAAERGE